MIQKTETVGCHRSRSFIQNEYKVSKPPLEKPSKADKAESSTLRVPLPKIAPAPTTVNSDGEEDLDALDEDDFANLSDSDLEWDSDDDLSVDEDLGGSDNLGDSDSIESDDLQDDADEWEGLAQSDSDASSHTLLADSDEEGLEDRYANIASKKQKRIDAEKAANGPSRLPVIMDGEVVQHKATKSKTEETEQNRISHKRKTAELSDEEADEEETLRKRMRAAKPKLNPLGARFGRPAVSSVLEIEDLGMRIQAAREELAVLGRDIIAEPEMSVRHSFESLYVNRRNWLRFISIDYTAELAEAITKLYYARLPVPWRETGGGSADRCSHTVSCHALTFSSLPGHHSVSGSAERISNYWLTYHFTVAIASGN